MSLRSSTTPASGSSAMSGSILSSTSPTSAASAAISGRPPISTLCPTGRQEARPVGQSVDIGGLPYGTRFLASSLDPTNSNRPYTDDYLRPYQGYGSIKWLQFDGNSSYHSLQVQVTRRFSQGLQFGAAWTWSKAMAYSDGDQGTVSTFVSRREYDYGLATYDRTHMLAINYLLDLPRLSKVIDHAFVKGVFDGWQMSGVTRFQSGSPLSLG